MTKAPKSKTGWHITNRHLKYGDERKVYEGEALVTDGIPVVCHNGMHAEPYLIKCLYNWLSRGSYICKVVISGMLANQMSTCLWSNSWLNQKFVGKRRKILAMVHKNEFYTALKELYNLHPNSVKSLNEEEARQVFNRAVELRDMMELDYHKRKK